MTFYFAVMGLIALVGLTILLLDWLSTRKERQSHHNPAR